MFSSLPNPLLLAFSATCTLVGWVWFDSVRRSKIRLYHVSSESGSSESLSNLPLGTGDSLARLVKSKVHSLAGKDAKLRGIWWLPGGHAQTAYTTVTDFTKVDPVTYERKLLKVADGGIIAIDISPPIHSSPIGDGETVIVVVHGLTGGSHEHYARSAVNALTKSHQEGGLGARCVVINLRGCNNSPVVTPKLYHAGSTDDVRPIVLWVTQTFPQCTIFGLGFSLGGNLLSKYAGEEGSECPMSGMVSLANPWDLSLGDEYCKSGTLPNRFVYRYVLGDALRSLHYLHRHIFLNSPSSPLPAHLLEKIFNMGRISLSEFDDIITSNLYGFKDSKDYYNKISSARVLHNLRIPLLGINSEDDPILGRDNLPYHEAARNPYFVLATTEVGGHMGWFEQQADGGLKRWYVKPVREFFAALLESYTLPRPRPRVVMKDNIVQQCSNPNIAYSEVEAESLKLFTSGAGESKLFAGW